MENETIDNTDSGHETENTENGCSDDRINRKPTGNTLSQIAHSYDIDNSIQARKTGEQLDGNDNDGNENITIDKEDGTIVDEINGNNCSMNLKQNDESCSNLEEIEDGVDDTKLDRLVSDNDSSGNSDISIENDDISTDKRISRDEGMESDEEEILKNTKFVDEPQRRPSRSRRSGVVNDTKFIERMLSTSSNNSAEDLTAIEVHDTDGNAVDDVCRGDGDENDNKKEIENENENESEQHANFYIGSNTPTPTKGPEIVDMIKNEVHDVQNYSSATSTPTEDVSDIYYEEGPKRLKRKPVVAAEELSGAKTYQDKNKLIIKFPNRKVSFEHSLSNTPTHDEHRLSPLAIDVGSASASPRTILKNPKRRVSFESNMYRHSQPTGHINYGYLHDEFLDKLEKRKISLETNHFYTQESEIYNGNGYGDDLHSPDTPMSDCERGILKRRESDQSKFEDGSTSPTSPYQNGLCKRINSSDSFGNGNGRLCKRNSILSDDIDLKSKNFDFSAHLRKDSIALTSEKFQQIENIHRHYNQYNYVEKESFWKRQLLDWKKYQLHICVLCIFISLVAIVVVGWHFHNRTNKMEKIGKRIFYDPETREMYLPNPSDTHRLYGKIGLNVPTWQLPFHCHSEAEKTKYTCLRWKDDAILRISYFEVPGVHCYNISWEQIRHNLIPHDCFHIGREHWYGPSNHTTPSWPLKPQPFMFSAASSRHFDAGTFSSAIDYHWISSAGAAIFVPNNVPLQVKWNEEEGDLCLIARYQGDFYGGHTEDFAKLNYTVCSGLDPVTTFKYTRTLMEKFPKSLPTKAVIEKPVWSFRTKTDKNIDNSMIKMAEQMKNESVECSLFEVAGKWQNKLGDLQVGDHMDNISTTVDIVESQGCGIIVEINPYFDVESKNFKEGFKNGYFIKDSSNYAPGIVKFQHEINAMLDVTNKDASEWMKRKIKSTKRAYKIKGFSVVYGKPYWVPYNPAFKATELNPSTLREMYTEMFFSVVQDSRSDIIEGTSHTQDIPLIIPVEAKIQEIEGQSCLSGVIENALALGIKGYPFIISDLLPQETKTDIQNPPMELFIRWMQLSTFFPAIRYTIMPWDYGQTAVEISKNLTILHKMHVSSAIFSLKSDIEAGLPILRPIWWVFPDDEVAFTISDEFLVGDNILVAPVMCAGVEERKIYFPGGMWSDKSNGNLIRGKSWIRYKVNRLTIPHFFRVKVLTEVPDTK